MKKTMGRLQKRASGALATAVASGYELKRAAIIIRCKAPRDKGMDKRDEIDCFMQLYQADWHSKVVSRALDNLAFRKHNSPEVLLFATDLLALRKCVVHRLSVLAESVSKGTNTSKEDWRELAELCLTRLIMLNKRRGRPKYFV